MVQPSAVSLSSVADTGQSVATRASSYKKTGSHSIFQSPQTRLSVHFFPTVYSGEFFSSLCLSLMNCWRSWYLSQKIWLRKCFSSSAFRVFSSIFLAISLIVLDGCTCCTNIKKWKCKPPVVFYASTATKRASTRPAMPPIAFQLLPKASWQGEDEYRQCGQRGHIRTPSIVASSERI